MRSGSLAITLSRTPGARGLVVDVTRDRAVWEYASLKVWSLDAGSVVDDFSGDEELGLVILSGTVSVRSRVGSWHKIGQRKSVFEGMPYVVYLPPNVEFHVEAITTCEFARAGSRAEVGAEAQLIVPEAITEEMRGQGNASRRIRHVLEADRPAQHLFLVEVVTPSGNWSSYPPHKHDTDNPPNETYLEELYYHRIRPEQGFGFQRVYAPDSGLDEAIVIRDGTVVSVPCGYHPTVIAPGYELYYLNVMAGPVREWRFTDDPDHAWVAREWQPYAAPD